MIKKNGIVNSLWIDSIIGDLQVLCIQSFLKKGIDFNLYTYNQLKNAPEGAIIKDANEILNQSNVFKDNKNSYATYSDWFRIELLHKVGGWWVDCDVYCIKPFNIKQPFVFATEKLRIDDQIHTLICNAVIKMPAETAFGEKLIAAIKATFNVIIYKNIKTATYRHIKWTEIGAQMLCQIIDEEGLLEYVVIPEVFCPNDYQDYKQLCESENLSLSENTYGVHLWNKMWEWNEIAPLQMASENSFLGKAKIANI